MNKIKSLIKALLLLFIVQIGFLSMLVPLVENNKSELISVEPIALPTPSYDYLQPETALQARSFHELEYMLNEWIIPSHQVSELINDGKIEVKKELPELGLTIVKTINGETALNRSPHVFQNFIIRNDELFSTSTSHSRKNSLETTLEWVGAEDLHKIGLDGTGITVAILDSGISPHNLVNTLSGSNSYVDGERNDASDSLGHGTQVASIVSQVAPEASLYNYRVFNSEGQTELTWILEALNDILAMNETIDIVQMSFGGYGIVNEMNTVMKQLISAGLIPIVAAGNSGPFGQSISRPAHSPYTIAVGAAVSPNEVAAFSSQGPRLNGLAGPELIAPGFNVEVASLKEESPTIYQNGTSFAAPFVSGGVALLLSGDSLTRETRNESRFWKLKAALMSSANSLDQFPSVAVGAGFVNLENAFETLKDDVVVSMAPRSINPSNYFFQISTNGQTKKFPISIYSAEEYTVSHNATEVPSGIQLNLSIPDKISVGLNVLNLSIEIDTNLKMDKYRTNLDLQINSKLLSLAINLETRYSGGRILWDLRYDNDTNSAAFSNGYFGDNSVLAHWLTSIGRTSAAVVGNESDFYGTGYTYQSEDIIQALENHDLLVISDPEFPYLSSEISLIQSWVSQGNSLLVITDLDNQTSGTQEGTDHTTLNALLDDYGIMITNRRIPTEQNSTVPGTTVSHDDSAIGPFSSQFSFDFVGVELEVTENSNTKEIAYSGDDVIAAAHRTTLGGAVVVVGSSFPFSNWAYYIPNADNNFKFSFQIIDWLLNVQQPIVKFAYSTNSLGFLGFDSESKFTVNLSEREGKSINESQFSSFKGTLIESNGHYLQLAFRKKGDAFEASWKPTTSGLGILYVSIQIPGYAPLNGALQVDVVDSAFPIFLVLLLILGVFGVGFFVYNRRKGPSTPDYRLPPTPRAADDLAKQDHIASNSKIGAEGQILEEAICISCGMPLFSGAAFCEKCGARQTPKEGIKAKSSCPKCGSSIRLANARFCESCGNLFEG